MNRILSIAALIGIILQCSGKAYVLVNFELNKKYIAKELCIKKDDPDNCCKGHCYLNAQLEEEEEKEKNPPSGGMENKQEDQVCNYPAYFRELVGQTILLMRYVCSIPNCSPTLIFRPPRA